MSWATILRSALFASLFIALQTAWLPRWVGLRGSWRAAAGNPWRLLGLVPAVFGALVMLACIWKFARAGDGTPAPWDPPRQLVVRGPYKFVRNPMYLGMALFLVGEATLFAEFSRALLIYGLVLVIITNLFVLLYEEPTLRAKFGREYENYCAATNRWLPWQPQFRKAVTPYHARK